MVHLENGGDAKLFMFFLTLGLVVEGDLYLNSPRGSNNKLSEQSNNVNNAERLFDSQNNNAAGYQIGDDCRPVCQDEDRNYDPTKSGAMQGVMTFYQGSELYIEWHLQHGCGTQQPNVMCQLILQYMSEEDNGDIRDGTQRGNANTAGGQQEPPDPAEASDATLGQHEPVRFYLDCRARERNKGLYVADRNMNNNRGATATRQNPGGNDANNRHGLECPEERDYYPYWHPTPWHDIAVLTDEPEQRCNYYKAESQNVKAKGYCSSSQFNNPGDCHDAGGEWKEQPAWDEDPPDCVASVKSRDNHNGNVRNGRPNYYRWVTPSSFEGRTVLRMRYNMTVLDFEGEATANQDGPATKTREIQDYFFVDASYNEQSRRRGGRRRVFKGGPPILEDNPEADWLDLGGSRLLQLNLNTNQMGRTFQDRTHTFVVTDRPNSGVFSGLKPWSRIINYNVRGRRGNIVQVYPSVEYDFVPQELVVETGTFLHFQWTGSDANPKNNEGNGRQGTDRSNLVLVKGRGENVPVVLEDHTLFVNGGSDVDEEMVAKFAYLDQDKIVTCDSTSDNEQATTNCKQLNGASAYFNGGLVEMSEVGTHHIVSTRNNDFSNRSQKATIAVVGSTWAWWVWVLVLLGTLLGVAFLAYVGVAVYGFMHPTSRAFSKRYRPRILRWFIKPETLQKKIEERREYTKQIKKQLHAAATSNPTVLGKSLVPQSNAGRPSVQNVAKKQPCWLRCCQRYSLYNLRWIHIAYSLVNLIVFLIGLLSHLGAGFEGSVLYAIGKGAGATLNMNFSLLLLPTLRSLQTAVCSATATREWFPFHDPIALHVAISVWIACGAFMHALFHILYLTYISGSIEYQEDTFGAFAYDDHERISGKSVWHQMWDISNRCAPTTGFLLVLYMLLFFITSLPCVRKASLRATKWFCCGYKLFWGIHCTWGLLFFLLLLHSPRPLWIWLFFPAVLVVLDRLTISSQQSFYAPLIHAKLLSASVMKLSFTVPVGFTYQAGQYVLLGWCGEWHPFALTSSPEEHTLTLHIRAPENLDWCAALRHRIFVEAPAGLDVGATGKEKRELEYEARGDVHSDRIYSQPVRPSQGRKTVEFESPRIGRTLGSAEQGPPAPPKPEDPPMPPTKGPTDGQSVVSTVDDTLSAQSLESLLKETTKLPKDSIVLQMQGPFGAPVQKFWHFDSAVVVASGLGVLSFATILRNVQVRLRLKRTIPWNGREGGTVRRGVEELLENAVAVPKKIYFYCLACSQEDLDWLNSILTEAIEGPAKEALQIVTFVLGEGLPQQIRLLEKQETITGFPEWTGIFKKIRDANLGQSIGVFLSGSPGNFKGLSEQCLRHSDAPGTPGRTKFTLFHERF